MDTGYPLHPALTASREKLRRATEHLDAVTAEITAFLDRDPYRIAVEFERDTGWWVAKARIAEEPGPRLSVLVGEIAYECLSALNHLVWELAARKGGRRNVFKIKAQVQFPIALSEQAWNDNALVHHARVSKTALALIERSQPYNGPDGPKGAAAHPLQLIKEIADADKHRVLAGVFSRARHSGVILDWDTSRASGPHTETVTAPGRPLYHGTPIARIRFAHANEEANVRVRGKPPLEILFRTDNQTVTHDDLIDCPHTAVVVWSNLAHLFVAR